ncbi:UNVERIFIED_ORG: hypothetical protein J2W85_005918 [Ensifer adhaerens]|nr:hypothetical protein [Ensifer adhaerens]
MKFIIAGVASARGEEATYQIKLAAGPQRSRGFTSEDNSSGQNRSGKTTYSK